MSDKCPFCQSASLMPVKNGMGKHWICCTNCKASGPHTDDADSAVAAFNNITLPAKPGVIARLLARKENDNGKP